MSMTPLYTLLIVALLLALLAVTCITLTGAPHKTLHHRQKANSHPLGHEQRDLEGKYDLIVPSFLSGEPSSSPVFNDIPNPTERNPQ